MAKGSGWNSKHVYLITFLPGIDDFHFSLCEKYRGKIFLIAFAHTKGK